MSDLLLSRSNPVQIQRVDNLFEILPKDCKNVLEIGARDGHLSLLLTKYFESVHALDLELPEINHEKITCIKGDATDLEYDDNTFEVVFCTEVLEHIPKKLLQKACDELLRVSSKYIVIGVPYKQDLRSGRTTCQNCKKSNPPWGHINVFTKHNLLNLFKKSKARRIDFVGTNTDKTNYISYLLMKLAGNPYGTYDQDEPCIYCDHSIIHPGKPTFIQFILAKVSSLITKVQRKLSRRKPNWIHIVFEK